MTGHSRTSTPRCSTAAERCGSRVSQASTAASLPARAGSTCSTRPTAVGRTGSRSRRTGACITHPWQVATWAASTRAPARRPSCGLRPPTRERDACGRIRAAECGRASGTRGRSRSTTRRQSNGANGGCPARARRRTRSSSTTRTRCGSATSAPTRSCVSTRIPSSSRRSRSRATPARSGSFSAGRARYGAPSPGLTSSWWCEPDAPGGPCGAGTPWIDFEHTFATAKGARDEPFREGDSRQLPARDPVPDRRRRGAGHRLLHAGLGATERGRMGGPDGKIGHAELAIGDSVIMLADEHPDMAYLGPKSIGGTSVTIHVYVEDSDATFDTAVKAGAKSLRPVEDQFYGDRSGQFEDPFGHRWNVSTHIEDVPPEEMAKRAAAMAGG